MNPYAVASNGQIDIEGEFVTDGPLSDIYSNDVIKTGRQKVVFTGDVISAVAIQTGSVSHKPNPSEGHSFRVVSQKVEIKVKSVDEVARGKRFTGKFKAVSEGTLVEDTARGGMVLTGDEIYIGNPLNVDGDLYIDAQRVTINAPLLVKGNVVSTGTVSVDLGSPFEDAVVVDGNFSAKDLTVVGKMNVGGNFTAEGAFDLVGSLVVNGGITLKGKTKIAYVDTIYKAALLSAQQYFGETLLVHSQIFKNAKGQNTVALFTFIKGYVISNEALLLGKIQAGTIVPEDYYSVLIGASGQYATELAKYEGVAPYYRAKARVLDSLKKRGYDNLAVVEAIHVPLETFYLTFRQRGGEIIGTYLIGGDPTEEDPDALVALTEADRVLLVDNINNAEQIFNDYVAARNSAIENMAPKEKANGLRQDTSFDAEETLEETAPPGVMRTEEWRSIKNLPEEIKEVEVEEEHDGGMKKPRYIHKKLIKVLVVVAVIVNPVAAVATVATVVGVAEVVAAVQSCQTNVQVRMIKDVNETSTDRWAQDISLKNQRNSCSPTSAAMILRYHGHPNILRNRPSLYQHLSLDTRSDPYGFVGSYYPTLPLALALRSAMETSNSSGTLPWKIAPGIDTVLSQYGVRGDAEWIYHDINGTLFQKFRDEVEANRPPIVNIGGDGGWATEGPFGGHTMPVLGTKRESQSGCVSLISKHWLYVHTTWRLSDRRWYRFDGYVYPLAVWDGVSVRVD